MSALLSISSNPYENNILFSQWQLSSSSVETGGPISIPLRHLPITKLHARSRSTNHNHESGFETSIVGVFASVTSQTHFKNKHYKIIKNAKPK